MRFSPANAQHIGDRRTQQDSFGFGDLENRAFVAHGGFLAVVCDGMGGMEFGDAASRTATQAFLGAYQAKTAGEGIPEALERSVRTANDAVVSLAHEYGLSEGMGTTLVATALHDSELYYISVGDSGIFHLHGGALRMINHPHVFANLLDAAVARGTMSQADAQNHPERESLTSFIGAETLEEIDRNSEPIQLAEGDVILLASDGLFKTLSQGEILACLEGNPQTWPDALVAQTMVQKHEHQDNVTVLSIAAESDVPAVDSPMRRPQLGTPPVRATATISPGAAAPPESTQVSDAPVFRAPGVNAPVLAPTSDALGSGPPAPSRSRVALLLVVIIILLAAGGAWWFFYHSRTSKLTSGARAHGPDSAVSAPPRATPYEIKVDPDAPAQPPQVQASEPEGKGSPEKKAPPNKENKEKEATR
jgi:PPM family protein phosphatase